MVSSANNAADRLLAALPTRGESGARFAALGFPTTRDEDWRFTNVMPIAELEFTSAAADADPRHGKTKSLQTHFYRELHHAINLVYRLGLVPRSRLGTRDS